MALTREPLPRGLKKVTVDGRVVIRQNWFRSLSWGGRGNGWNLILLPIVAVGVMVYWQGPKLRQGMLPGGAEVIAVVLGGMLALLCVYYALAHLVNNTTLEFSGGVLRMDYGPLRLPWRSGPCFIPETDIVKVICIECERGERASDIYDIAVATRHGKRTVLFHRLLHYPQVSYLIQEICSRLKINDSVERR